MTPDPAPPDSNRFADLPVSRREFARLVAATGGALSLSGLTTAEDDPAAMTDRYAFVIENTDDEYAAPTLISLADEAALGVVEDLDADVATTTSPTVAAHADLGAEAADALARRDGVERLAFAPGANPFWRLESYPGRVFPPVEESAGFLWYDEVRAGLDHLAAEHPSRLRVRSIGESPGHENRFRGETVPGDVFVAEMTEGVDDETFREKPKVLFSLSIHGDERAGAEAGTRLIERVLAGDEPEIRDRLEDVVLLFLYPNPDGWVSRSPTYGYGNAFERGTATGKDPNRQYPMAGWIDPGHVPAEPRGRNLQDDVDGIDFDVDESTWGAVPDSLAIVEHLREYEHIEYGSDLHGMTGSEAFVKGLVMNAGYGPAELHDLDELNRRLDERLDAAVGQAVETRRDLFRDRPGAARGVPGTAYEYGTILDTIGYTTSGGLMSWASHPESRGGLGITAMAHEMAFDNRIGPAREYVPDLVDLQVRAYGAVIRELTVHATRDVTATVETGDRTAGYVTTDALVASSDDLDIARTTRDVRSNPVLLATGPGRVTVPVDDAADALSVTFRSGASAAAMATLLDPEGERVRTGVPGHDRDGWYVESPAAGDWSVRIQPAPYSPAQLLTVSTAVIETEPGGSIATPDPREAVGYRQREYRVTPLSYFDAYAETLDAGFRAFTPESIAGDDLVGDGPRVDHLVVTHDRGREVESYVQTLRSFLDAGGTLVLTDAGVRLLAALEVGIAGKDIETVHLLSGVLSGKGDHHLLAGTRGVQRELYRPTPLGYPVDRSGSAPMTVVDADAFEAAGGSVAAQTGFRRPLGVAAGTLEVGEGAIHVVGGLLPPTNQNRLHPFGLLPYTTTHLGQTVLSNALGHRQERRVDGTLVGAWGPGD